MHTKEDYMDLLIFNKPLPPNPAAEMEVPLPDSVTVCLVCKEIIGHHCDCA